MAMKSQSSGIALAAAAVFYQTFSLHTQQEVECIAKLKAMQPAPDLAFVVFVRGIELSDSTAAEGGLAPIDRVMFEQMAEETRGLRATALRSMVELWAHLEQKKPDLWQVLQTGARLDADIVRCDKLFGRMLRLNPESTTILRAYSGFLSGLGFDPVRGMELRNRADRIDEVASRQRVGKAASVSLFSYGASLKGNRQLQLALTDASSPVVTISTSSSNRGEIVAVTPAAAKLLLASRADSLIGQNISTIVPPPFQDFHQRMLNGFGRSVTTKSSIVGHEIMLPVARRDGTIIACNLTFDESPPDATTMQPRLAAVLQPVPSANELILFLGEANGYRVASASRGALALLGLDAGALKERHIQMTSFLPSLAQSFVPFLGRASGYEALQCLRNAASLAETGTGSGIPRTSGLPGRPTASGRDQHAAGSLMAQAKPNKRGVATVRVPPLLSLKETGLVPLEVQGAPFASVLAGSVQHLKAMGSDVFLLRFVPTRLVIPAGVPLEGEDADIVLEDLGGASARPSFGDSPASWRAGTSASSVETSSAGVEAARAAESLDSSGALESRPGSDSQATPATPRIDLFASPLHPDSKSAQSDAGCEAARDTGDLPGLPLSPGDQPDGKVVGSPDLTTPRAAAAAGVEGTAAPGGPESVVSESTVGTRSDSLALLRPNPRMRDPANLSVDVGSEHADIPRVASKLSVHGKASIHPVGTPAKPLKGALRAPRQSASSFSSPASHQETSPSESKASGVVVAGNMFGDGASSAGESTAGGAAQIGGLLRAVQHRNDRREDETNRIRLVLLLSAACVVAASAGTAAWIDQSRKTLEGRSEGLQMSTTRMHAFHEAWTCAVGIFTNVSGASDISLGDLSQLHESFCAAAELSHHASKVLHDAAERSGPLGAAYDIDHKFQVVEPSTSAGSPPKIATVSIANADAFIFDALGVLAALSPHQWVTKPGVHAFKTLVMNEVLYRSALERSVGQREHDFAVLLPAMAEEITYAGTAFLVGVILTSLIAITIAVTSLWHRSVSTMRLFLTFPAEVSGSLRQLASIQLEAADVDGTAEVDDSDDDGDDDFGADGPATSPGKTGLTRTDEAGLMRAGAPAEDSNEPSPDGRAGGRDAPAESDDAMRNQVINEAEATARWEAALKSLKAIRRSRGRRHATSLFPDREFSVSNGFVISSLLWLLLPVVMIGVWLGTVVLVSVASYDRSSGQAKRILQASHVRHHIDEIESYSVLATSNRSTLSALLNLPGLQETVLSYDARSTAMLTVETRVLLFGGNACSAIKLCEKIDPLREGEAAIAPLSAAMYLSDGCIGVSGVSEASCRTVGGGVMSKGLLAAVARISSLSRQLLDSFSNASRSTPTQLELQFVRDLTAVTHPHARDGFARASADLVESTLAVLVEGQSIVLTATWVFALVYMVVTAVWLSSQISHLAWPLRTARRLVRFLPADLVLVVPSLRHGLREVASGFKMAAPKQPCCQRRCCARSTRRVAIAETVVGAPHKPEGSA
ncbi:hypothetical protein FNF27_08132 [Cafeteria roenbergensis]|uniref:TmcB/TmcC TPR repeats domain-containing protein n=1 Tax=Cafeteria roenbergensis TaxID=33653 RepID=A0A5A8DA63_CAFRO|nr:hypothetical protein FNF27_08132 [Cafeteria roenbergensis]